MRTIAQTGAVAALGFVLVGTLAGQTIRTVTIPGAVSCTTCSIDLVKVATIGSADDPELLSERARITRDSHGRYAALLPKGDGFVVYDGAGKYVNRYGRAGHGPGEFFAVYALMFGPGDSLWVMNGIYSMVFSPAFEYVRSSTRPSSTWGSALPLNDGSLVYSSAELADPTHFLFIIGPSGTITHAFEDGRDAFQTGAMTRCNGCLTRFVTTAREPNSFWSLAPRDFHLRRWTTTGGLAEDIVVTSPTFRPFTSDSQPAATERPHPRLRDVSVDSRGRFIVAGSVASKDWQPNTELARASKTMPGGISTSKKGSVSPMGLAIAAKNYATLLQVIDPALGRVVAERQLDGEIVTLLPGGLAYTHRSDTDGFAYVDVWRIEVKGSPK